MDFRRLEMARKVNGIWFFSLEEIQQADNDMQGFCIECGELNDGCEPDARLYTCECCNAQAVYGAQELALMERVE
jgi:hypothetical protein